MKFEALRDMTPFRLVVNDVSEDFCLQFQASRMWIIQGYSK